MKYEYDFVSLKLTEDQQQAIQLGIVNVEIINPQIRDIINARGQEGWEALYPFSLPGIWFKRTIEPLSYPAIKPSGYL